MCSSRARASTEPRCTRRRAGTPSSSRRSWPRAATPCRPRCATPCGPGPAASRPAPRDLLRAASVAGRCEGQVLRAVARAERSQLEECLARGMLVETGHAGVPARAGPPGGARRPLERPTALSSNGVASPCCAPRRRRRPRPARPARGGRRRRRRHRRVRSLGGAPGGRPGRPSGGERSVRSWRCRSPVASTSRARPGCSMRTPARAISRLTSRPRSRPNSRRWRAGSEPVTWSEKGTASARWPTCGGVQERATGRGTWRLGPSSSSNRCRPPPSWPAPTAPWPSS